MSLPSARGTVNINTAKAAIRHMPIAIFFGAVFGCAATSKTYVIIKPSYKYSSGSLKVLCNDASDIVCDLKATLARLFVETLPHFLVRLFERVKHKAHSQESLWRSALDSGCDHFFLQSGLRCSSHEPVMDLGPPRDPYGLVGSDLAILDLLLQLLRQRQDAKPLTYGALRQTILCRHAGYPTLCRVDQLFHHACFFKRRQVLAN